MTTTATSRSPGCFRGYSNEQKTLRAKLAQLLKWTRDLKTNIMKQSCKALQNNSHQTDENRRQTVDQIHDELDEYKRKLDRELGRIHDICDALTNNPQSKNGADENLDDEILAALRRSPTYSSLEQHIYDDRRPRIRVKPRERIHPGRSQIPRSPFLSTDTIKRKATQPVALQLLDTSCTSGTGKRRAPVDAFKRSRSFTNVEHQETTLGIDYIEEDESDLAWKPFEPKRSISQTTLPSFEHNTDEASTISSITETPAVPKEKSQVAPPSMNEGSSDDEFDVAWERRAKQKARKEAAAPPPPPVPPQLVVESPSKRSVRFAPSSDEPTEVVDLDFDDPTPIASQQTTDQNNNHKQQDELIISVISIDEDDIPVPTIEKTSNASQSQITTSSSQQRRNRDGDGDDAQVIEDSDDDDVIALSDDETSNKPLNRARKKVIWTSSEIQISSGSSQSQSMHNPYRVGIADPSLRSIFLPPPPPASSQSTSGSNSGNRRNQGGSQRKTSPNKRTTNGK